MILMGDPAHPTNDSCCLGENKELERVWYCLGTVLRTPCLPSFVTSVYFAGPSGHAGEELGATCVSRLGCPDGEEKDKEEHTYRTTIEKCLASMKCGQLNWVTEKPLKEKFKSRRPQEHSGKMITTEFSLVLERMGYYTLQVLCIWLP